MYRTALFLGGLAVVVIATQSGIGSYDDVLFWDHMVQHLLLLMVAPPLLVVHHQATLLLHASRNPLHTWTKKVLRSRVMAAITWPPFGDVALYLTVIVGTHLTGFMNLVESNGAVHDGEHVLYLAAGYLYFLPLLGREPIRWRVSYPTGSSCSSSPCRWTRSRGWSSAAEGSNPFPALADHRPGSAPSPVTDVHIGGAVMWVGSEHHVRPGAGGVLRLEPGKARRRRPRLARVRAPLELRHAGHRAPGRERRKLLLLLPGRLGKGWILRLGTS